MRPYFERDGVAIYHGDCLSILEALSLTGIAAVASDPPYSSGNLPESLKQKTAPRLRGRTWEDKVMETDQLSTIGFIWLMREVLVRLREGMEDGASVLAFIDWRNWANLAGAVESVGLRVNNMVVWDKTTFGMGNGFRNQHELVLFGSKGTPRVVDHGTPNVLQFKRDPNDMHQSPKPVALMEALLRVVAAPGDLIVDPFAGSFSTILAAKALGMRAVGIEVEERYCETGCRRLEAAHSAIDVRSHELGQAALFGGAS